MTLNALLESHFSPEVLTDYKCDQCCLKDTLERVELEIKLLKTKVLESKNLLKLKEKDILDSSLSSLSKEHVELLNLEVKRLEKKIKSHWEQIVTLDKDAQTLRQALLHDAESIIVTFYSF